MSEVNCYDEYESMEEFLIYFHKGNEKMMKNVDNEMKIADKNDLEQRRIL